MLLYATTVKLLYVHSDVKLGLILTPTVITIIVLTVVVCFESNCSSLKITYKICDIEMEAKNEVSYLLAYKIVYIFSKTAG